MTLDDFPDRQRGFASDADHLVNIEALTAECEAVIARKGSRATVKYELPALHWLAIFDEIKNRRRENFSKLVADRHVTEMQELITQLNDLIVYMLANIPGNITQAMAFDASVVRGKPVANRLLAGLENLKAMRDKGGPI